MAPSPRHQLAVVAMALVAISMPFPLPAHGAAFCEDYLAAFRCPSISTVDTVNLAKYTGRWYEVGSTASFRFTFEIGLTCTTANYSANGKAGGKNRVKVVNRGRRAVAAVRRAQIFALSLNARRISQRLQSICSAAVAVSKTQAQAHSALAASGGSLLSLSASAALLATARTASDEVKRIDDSLRVIQAENDRVSQNSRPVSPSMAASKKKIIGALMRIRSSARRIAAAALTGRAATQAVLGLKGGQRDAKRNGQSAASGVVTAGKLILSSAAIGRLAAVMAVPALALSSSPLTGLRAAVAEGKALQSKSNAGRLSVSFGPATASSPNYLISELQGDESVGYSLATVVSCSRGQTTIWLLSRTPSVAQASIDAAIANVESKGVRLTGANPFLLTKRDPSYCNSYWNSLN